MGCSGDGMAHSLDGERGFGKWKAAAPDRMGGALVGIAKTPARIANTPDGTSGKSDGKRFWPDRIDFEQVGIPVLPIGMGSAPDRIRQKADPEAISHGRSSKVPSGPESGTKKDTPPGRGSVSDRHQGGGLSRCA